MKDDIWETKPPDPRLAQLKALVAESPQGKVAALSEEELATLCEGMTLEECGLVREALGTPMYYLPPSSAGAKEVGQGIYRMLKLQDRLPHLRAALHILRPELG